MRRSLPSLTPLVTEASLIDATGYMTHGKPAASMASDAVNALLSSFVSGVKGHSNVSRASPTGSEGTICCVMDPMPADEEKSAGSRKLVDACAALRIPYLGAPLHGYGATDITLPNARDLLIAAKDAILLPKQVQGLSVFTDDKAAAHYLLSHPSESVAVMNLAHEVWSKDILVHSASRPELSAEHQLQYQQLVDYWAMSGVLSDDVARRLLQRFQSLEALEVYCQTATGEAQKRLTVILGAAKDLHAARSKLLPQPDRAQAFIGDHFAAETIGTRPDLSPDAIEYITKELGLSLNAEMVKIAQELLSPPAVVLDEAPTFSIPKKVVDTPMPNFANSPAISDDELVDALTLAQLVTSQKQAEYKAERDIVRSRKQELNNEYLEYVLKEFNRFCDIFAAEDTDDTPMLPQGFFEALRHTPAPLDTVRTLLDEATDQVATMSPEQLGVTGDKLLALFDMLESATTVTVDFNLPGNAFQDSERHLTPSQMMAQRVIGSALPFPTYRGVNPLREKGKPTYARTFEGWHKELAAELSMPKRTAGANGSMIDLRTAIRKIALQGAEPTTVLPRKSKKGDITHVAPKLVLVHINAADNLFLQMLHKRRPSFGRSAVVSLYAASLTALFQAKQSLIYDGVLLIPVITGLSTHYCPEIEVLESNCHAFKAVKHQLVSQDPRTPLAVSSTDEVEPFEKLSMNVDEIFNERRPLASEDAEGKPTMIDPVGLERMKQTRPIYGPDAEAFAEVAKHLGAEGSTPFAESIRVSMEAQNVIRPVELPAPKLYVDRSLMTSVGSVLGMEEEQSSVAIAEPSSQSDIDTTQDLNDVFSSFLQSETAAPEVDMAPTAVHMDTPTFIFPSESALEAKAEEMRANRTPAITMADEQLRADVAALGEEMSAATDALDDGEVVHSLLFGDGDAPLVSVPSQTVEDRERTSQPSRH